MAADSQKGSGLATLGKGTQEDAVASGDLSKCWNPSSSQALNTAMGCLSCQREGRLIWSSDTCAPLLLPP